MELKRTFIILARQNLKGFKIYFFINSLNKYIKDQKKILDLFKTIINNFVIKVVVLSRLKAIFKKTFCKSPKL